MRIDLETEYDPPAFIKNQSDAAYRIEESEINDQVARDAFLVIGGYLDSFFFSLWLNLNVAQTYERRKRSIY